jgi:hypothetical protein
LGDKRVTPFLSTPPTGFADLVFHPSHTKCFMKIAQKQ